MGLIKKDARFKAKGTKIDRAVKSILAIFLMPQPKAKPDNPPAPISKPSIASRSFILHVLWHCFGRARKVLHKVWQESDVKDYLVSARTFAELLSLSRSQCSGRPFS